MLNIAICEDCLTQTEIIQMLLDQYQEEKSEMEMCTYSFQSSSELLESLDSGRRFDLFLLDILMPEKSGIELARELRERHFDAAIIFLTSAPEFSLDAFEVWAIQYMLKPITKNKLFPVLEKVIASIRTFEKNYFILPTQGRIVNIPFSSIAYVEFLGRALQVNLVDGEILFGTTIRIPFEEAAAPLLDDDRFLHPHKSFVINMNYVKEIGRASFTMKNGMQIPIPRSKYTNAKKEFLTFIDNQRGTF